MRGRRDAPAELGGHCLHSVADAKHRHAELEYRFGRARRRLIGDRFRTPGKDYSAGAEGQDGSVTGIPRENFAIDADLAHAPGDQLRVLGAEVEDQDPVGMDIGRGGLHSRSHQPTR